MEGFPLHREWRTARRPGQNPRCATFRSSRYRNQTPVASDVAIAVMTSARNTRSSTMPKSKATLASTMINFKPEPGMMMFAPAWLAHSFGRNASKEPFRFVHFNLTVQQTAPTFCPASAEIV